MFSGLIGGPEPEPEPASLLQDWNRYAQSQPAALQPPSQPPPEKKPFANFAAKLQQNFAEFANGDLSLDNVKQMAASAASKAKEAASNVNLATVASQGIDKAKAAASTAQVKAKAAVEKVETGASNVMHRGAAGLVSAGGALKEGIQGGIERLQTLSHERLLTFFCLLIAGQTMLLLSFFIGLPAAALFPAKFAIPFTIGSGCNMGAVAALRGYHAQAAHMLSKERLPFSTVYVGSMLATLWSAIVAHSYVLCMLASMVQVVALFYYMFSYFPGGTAGIKLVAMSAGRVFRPVMASCGRCLAGNIAAEVDALLPA